MTQVGGGSPAAIGAQPRLPRQLVPGLEPTDRIFHGSARVIGMSVLAITGAIGIFLGYQSIPTLHHYGLHFFTEVDWQPELNRIGIAAVLVGTLEVALVAMAVAFPLAFALALFISDYAPARVKSWLVSAVDLMAAVPSIIYGLWGFFLLQPHAIKLARWLSQHFGWFPVPCRHRRQCRRVAAIALHEFRLHRRSCGRHDGDSTRLRRDAGRVRSGPSR